MSAKVLVVDDNLANLELAAFLLQRDDFEVGRAMNALEAREVAKTFKPDLVLMDVQLPEVDGLTAALQMKANPATEHIPIVAFTAYAMRGDAQRLLASGFDGYIAKPVDPSTFAAQVRSFLRPA
jgi:CheY-like chemotaxis protein